MMNLKGAQIQLKTATDYIEQTLSNPGNDDSANMSRLVMALAAVHEIAEYLSWLESKINDLDEYRECGEMNDE